MFFFISIEQRFTADKWFDVLCSIGVFQTMKKKFKSDALIESETKKNDCETPSENVTNKNQFAEFAHRT